MYDGAPEQVSRDHHVKTPAEKLQEQAEAAALKVGSQPLQPNCGPQSGADAAVSGCQAVLELLRQRTGC